MSLILPPKDSEAKKSEALMLKTLSLDFVIDSSDITVFDK